MCFYLGIDIFNIIFLFLRTFYNACSTHKSSKSGEVIKSVNLLFSTLESQYVWIHCGYLFEKACQYRVRSRDLHREQSVKEVGSGIPDLPEICALTEFLLDTVSLDAFIDAPSEHLPNLFYNVIDKLSQRVDYLDPTEIAKSLQLCGKILSKVQPAISGSGNNNTSTDKSGDVEDKSSRSVNVTLNETTTTTSPSAETSLSSSIPLEKSQSDSKLNKQESENTSFSDRSPSPRRRANSSGPSKKNDKKGKKKASKSTSKLSDATVTDGSNISVVVSEDAVKSSKFDQILYQAIKSL